MNFDEATLQFMNNLYTTLCQKPSDVSTFYKNGAKLNVCSPENVQEIKVSDYEQLLPKGEHKIFRSDSAKNGVNVSAHCSGYIKIDNDNFLQSNEMIIYDPTTNPFQIIYHSVNLSQMDPAVIPVEPVKKEEPEKKVEQEKKKVEEKKPAKDEPVCVDDPSKLMKSRTLLATNIPYNLSPKEILPNFESFGKITRYCTEKGKILVEYENPADMYNVLNSSLKLKNRWIYFKKMNVGFDIN